MIIRINFNVTDREGADCIGDRGPMYPTINRFKYSSCRCPGIDDVMICGITCNTGNSPSDICWSGDCPNAYGPALCLLPYGLSARKRMFIGCEWDIVIWIGS